MFQCDDKDYPQIKSRRFSFYLMTNLPPVDIKNMKPTDDIVVNFLQSKGEAAYFRIYNISNMTATGPGPTKAIIICETDFDSTGAIVAGGTITNLVYDDDIKSPGNVANTVCEGTRADICKYNDDGKGNYNIRLEGFTFGGYAVYPSGQAVYATTPALIATEFVTGVRDVPGTPAGFNVSQNYPNPFNPSTKIKFEIPKQLNVKLVVYDILGREVAVLVNKELSAGSYEVTFNGKDLTSGIYFYRLQSNEFVGIKKFVLMK